MEFIVTQIDEIHDKVGNLVGYQCFDGTGQSVKVKKGQGGHLEKKWGELQVGRAYSFAMGAYTPPGKNPSYPYVIDFTSMEKALEGKMPKPTPPPPPVIAPQERGKWMKEIGDWMRSGALDEWEQSKRLKPEFCKALRTTYWANLITGAGIEKVE